jgi:hypothetical protein
MHSRIDAEPFTGLRNAAKSLPPSALQLNWNLSLAGDEPSVMKTLALTGNDGWHPLSGAGGHS